MKNFYRTIIFVSFFFIQNTSAQIYRVDYTTGAFGCSWGGSDGSDPCAAGVNGQHTIILYDQYNNVLGSANSSEDVYSSYFEVSVIPAKIVQSSSCCTGSWENIINFNNLSNCNIQISNNQGERLKAKFQIVNYNNIGCNTNNLISCSGQIDWWEVKKTGSVTYVMIAGSENQNFLTRTYSDIYSNNSGLNQTTYFRAKLKDFEMYTNHPFVFTPCSPNITSTTFQNSSCNDSNNGSATFTFDRDLVANEYFNFTLYKKDLSGDILVNSNMIDQTTFLNQQFIWGGLEAGTYYLRYQTFQNNGLANASSVNSADFTITAPPPLTFSTTNTPVKCYGQPTGSITVAASGGTNTPSNLRYSKDGGLNWQNSDVFLGLGAGTYPVLVKEINGVSVCIAPSGVSNVTITQPSAALTVSLDNFQDVYLANTVNPLQQGFINTTVAGGTPPYTYVWTVNGVSFLNNNNPITEDLVDLNNPSGVYNYTLTVIDAASCTTSVTQQITSPIAVSATFVVDQIKCFGEKGKITATVSGGNAGAYSYNWIKAPNTTVVADVGTPNTISNLLAGTYILTVTDIQGVSKTFQQLTISAQPSALIVSASSTTVQQKCFGDLTDININVSGGTVPYGIKWYNLQNPTAVISTAKDLANAAPGTYTVVVTDNNCSKDQIFAINPATQIMVSASLTTIVDPAISSGAISLTVNGGSSPYTFLWNNGAASQNLSGVAAGIYSVRVTDSNGCIFNSPDYSITAPPPFIISISQTATNACFGAATAALTVTASGGTPATTGSPYSYLWTHNGTTLSSVSNLLAGTYTVQVKDNLNVVRTASYTVTQPEQITATAVASPATCRDATNGSIVVTVSDGTGTFLYKFNGETAFTPSNTKINLAAGTYSCEVQNAAGCPTVPIVINNIMVVQPATLTVEAEIKPVSAVGLADGQIKLINVTGGTNASSTAYTYSWADSTIATANRIGLQEGVYTVTITGNAGCSFSDTYTVGSIKPLTASVTQTTDIKCFGEASGALTVKALGGIQQYTYKWLHILPSNPLFANQPATISGLAAGFYSVTITDSNTPQSSVSASYTIGQPLAALSARVATQTNVSCFDNSTGAATVVATGGTISGATAYNYSWTKSADISFTAVGATVTGLKAGTYFCTIKDNNLCQVTQTVTITQPNLPLAVSVSTTAVTVFGQNTGSIRINATGGTSGYQYVLNGALPSTTTTVFNQLAAGSYKISVIDAQGCSVTLQDIAINQPAQLIGSASITTFITCNGGSNGELTADASGGDNANHIFQWTKIGFGTRDTKIIKNLTSGEYKLTVSDGTGASHTSIYNLTEPSSVSGTVSVTAVSCNNTNDGSITVTGSGGTPPYTYRFNDVGLFSTNNVLSGLVTGPNNSCEIQDSLGCQTKINFINVPKSPSPTISTVNIKPVSGFGRSDGAIKLTLGGTITPGSSYQVSWIGTIDTTLNPQNLAVGTYTVVITDNNLCTVTDSFAVTSPLPVTATITLENAVVCFGTATASIKVLPEGGSGDYKYLWSNQATSTTITNLTAGEYTVQVTDTSDPPVSITTTYTILPPTSILTAQITSQTNVLCYGQNTGAVTITASGGLGTKNYTWTNSAGIPFGPNSPSIASLSAETYTCLVSDNTCNSTVTVEIKHLNPAISVTITSTENVTIQGKSTGKFTIDASGGTGSFTYSYILNGQNISTASPTIENLPAGFYNLTVTDSNGCKEIISNIAITQPDPLVGNISHRVEDSLKCFGAANGVLIANASGGVLIANAISGILDYRYTWRKNGSFYSNDKIISNLSAGDYDVVVSDMYTSTQIITYRLSEPTAVTATFITTAVSCSGATKGTITINANGGLTPYTYKFTSENTFSASSVKTGLIAGKYDCEVRDSNSCTIILRDIVITQNAAPRITSAAITPVSAPGLANGQIKLTVTGAEPITFLWTGTANITANPTGLSVGTYTVVVTDRNNCSVSDTYNVTEILPLTATFKQTAEIKCIGEATGALTIEPVGGVPKYKYTWSHILPTDLLFAEQPETVSNLAAGVYSVIVTDNNTPASSVSASFTVLQPITAVSASVEAQTNVLCFGGNTGKATVAGVGGKIPYRYEWTNSMNARIGDSATVSGLIAGTYYCNVLDANLCQTSVTVVITQPTAPISATLSSVTHVTINGQNTGALTISAIGGTLPYTYVLNNGIRSSSPTFNALPSGTYFVQIIDANDCRTNVSGIIVLQPDVLVSSVFETTPNSIKCNGDNTGSLTATTFGGIGNRVYLWKKNGIEVGRTNPINNLTAGEYELTVSDNYTSKIVKHTLTQPAPLSATFTTTPVSCNGGNNGSITINPNGGTPPYTYRWSNGLTTQTQIGLTAGKYVVSIKDKYNCESGLLFSEVQPSGGINLNAVVVNGACNSTSNGSIAFTPSGGSGNFSISWANTSYTGFTQNNLPPGNYIGAITDTTLRCVIPFNYTITGGTPISLNLGNDVLLCNGQSIEIDGKAIGSNLNYAWTSTNGFTSNTSKVKLNIAGTYTLTITSANGCVYSDSIIVTTSQQSIDAKYLIASQTYKDEEIILINVSDKVNTSYSWVFPVQAQIISQNQDAAIIKFQNAGMYNIGLKGVNGAGCVMYDYKELVIDTNVNGVTNDNNNILVKKFRVYPNPIATNSNLFNLEVELALDQPLTISIFSISGSALINEITLPASKIHNKQFDLLNLSTGYYYVLIKTPGSIQAKKIIKQ